MQQEKSKWHGIGNVEVSAVLDLLLVGAVVVLIGVLLAGCDTRSELRYSNPTHQLEFCLSSVQTGECKGSPPQALPQNRGPVSDGNGNAVSGS